MMGLDLKSLSFLLKPKSLMVIGAVISLTLTGLRINSAIKDYGSAQYAAGKLACETAVKAKAAESKAKLEANKAAADTEAAKTETIYVDVVREVAVTDAVLIAENDALRDTLKRLKMENDNAPVDDSLCARTAIPNDSLRVHTEIDRLLRSD